MSLRASDCGLALQTAMRAVPNVSFKVVVAAGPTRRLVAGDPAIQLLDTLAGAILVRLSGAVHVVSAGEVVVDAATMEACPNGLSKNY